MTSRRLAVVAPSLASVLSLRSSLLSEVHKKGHRILCVSPVAADDRQAAEEVAQLKTFGAEFRPIRYETPGLRALNSYRVCSLLKPCLAEWKPDCVLGYGADVLCHAALAARRAKVQRVVSLCNDLPDFLKPIVDDSGRPTRAQFRRALTTSDQVVFHNSDHQRLMQDEGLLPSGAKSIVVAGRGVDVETQDVLPLPNLSSGLVFLMAARLESVRGIYDYVQAARRVSAHAPTAKFLLLGHGARDRLEPARLGFHGEPFEVLDDTQDLRSALKRAHVFVYPSHSEGMPPSVLEALAAGRPVITTDTPGCRDTIDETVNGYLIERGDVGALTIAMNALLKRPDMIPAMARASRLKAERRFDIRDVNETLITALQL